MRIDNSVVACIMHPKTKIPHRFVFPAEKTMHMAAAEAMLSYGLADDSSPPLTLADTSGIEYLFDSPVTMLVDGATYLIVERDPKDD